MRRFAWAAAFLLLLAACSDDGEAETTTTSTTAATTTTTSTTTTTTTTATTSSTTTTTTTLPPPDPQDEEAALARSLLLTLDDFAPGWSETPRDPDDDEDFDYTRLPGCDLIASLQDDESHTVEEESPTFSAGDAEFEQDARLYPSEEEAIAFISAWVDDTVLSCTEQGLEIVSAEAVDSGAFGPVDDFQTSVTGAVDEFDGFRLVSFSAVLTLETGDVSTPIHFTNWIMQRDRAAVRLGFVNVGEEFPDQDEFIALIATRFAAAGF